MSRPPRILVLQHAEPEDLGLLEPGLSAAADLDVLPAFGPPVAYRRLVDRELRGAGADAVILLGGPQSVYDHAVHETLEDSLRLTRTALRADLPMLGVCLGSQILAWSLGAQVRAGRTLGLRKEIGWFPLDLTERGKVDPLFHGFRSGDPVFHWHGDTFDLPAGSWHLARSPFYPNQAFRKGRWVYGLQFHVEVTPAMVAAWVDAGREELDELDYVDGQVLIAQAPQHVRRLEGLSRTVVEHFLTSMRQSVAEKSGTLPAPLPAAES